MAKDVAIRKRSKADAEILQQQCKYKLWQKA